VRVLSFGYIADVALIWIERPTHGRRPLTKAGRTLQTRLG
jgi:hypothetical protein